MKAIHTMIAIAALAGAASFAGAEEPAGAPPAGAPPEGGPREHRKPPAELIAKFDKDGDGKLNDDEKAAMKAAMEERRKEMLTKFDKDGDGKLNEEERKAAREAGGFGGPGGKRPHGDKKPKEEAAPQ
jgi:hypothetical protein